MKITKKDFIRTMVENTTTFLGVARKLYTSDELESILANFLDDSSTIVEKRSCKARSTFLEFSGGSRLGFDQIGKYGFYKYALSGKERKIDLYICRHTAPNNMEYCMHYAVEK